MKIEVKVGEKQLVFFLASFVVILIIGLVVAYNDPLDSEANPATMGHSVNEIDWGYPLPGNLLVNGNIGLGTDNPRAKLHIKWPGTSILNQISAPDSTSDILWFDYVDEIPAEIGTNFRWGLSYRGTYGADDHEMVLVKGTIDGGSKLDVQTWLPNGNVGIGTFTPEEKLEVSGGVKLNYIKFEPTNNPPACNADAKGLVYYDFSEDDLCKCNGTIYEKVGSTVSC